MKLYSNNYTLKTISNSNSNLHKKLYSKILIFLILIYKLLLIKLKFEMYLRAPSRCGGRRPGERCERPARVREPRGGRAGGGAGQRAGGRQRGRSGRAAALGDARGLKGGTLPPVEPAVAAYPAVGSTYRRFNRR